MRSLGQPGYDLFGIIARHGSAGASVSIGLVKLPETQAMQSASEQPPVLLQRDGPVVRLTINRPSAGNRLDNATTRALLAHVETLAADHGTRAVILTAAGETFSAGADLSALQDGAADAVGTWLRWGHRLTDAIAALPQPTLTAINGLAAGAGFELALATDLRLLARDARIGLPQVRQGMIPAWGGTQRLARLVGPSAAKELIYTGRLVGSEEALRRGLVNAVHPGHELPAAALALAQQLAMLPPGAIAGAKEAISSGLDRDLATGNQIEMAVFERLSGGLQSPP